MNEEERMVSGEICQGSKKLVSGRRFEDGRETGELKSPRKAQTSRKIVAESEVACLKGLGPKASPIS